MSLTHRIIQFNKKVLMNSLALRCPFLSIRLFLLKLAGLKLGKGVRINSNSFFSTSNIQIGDNTFINRFCQVHDGLMGGKLSVGRNCFISFNVVFCLVTHKIGTPQQRAGQRLSGDISIGDGTWIGCNVIIMPNVKIGKGCIIAAGSLVNRDCEDNCMFGGVPAKLIRVISDKSSVVSKEDGF